MNFSKQLKGYREKRELSQEELAEKIYVTRQTISKWENNRTYPDIHNLIALSILFNITLDELIKGDLEAMKSNPDVLRLRKLAIIEIFSVFIAAISLWPSISHLQWFGFIPPAILYIPVIISGIEIARIKKKNHVKTFRQIQKFLNAI